MGFDLHSLQTTRNGLSACPSYIRVISVVVSLASDANSSGSKTVLIIILTLAVATSVVGTYNVVVDLSQHWKHARNTEKHGADRSTDLGNIRGLLLVHFVFFFFLVITLELNLLVKVLAYDWEADRFVKSEKKSSSSSTSTSVDATEFSLPWGTPPDWKDIAHSIEGVSGGLVTVFVEFWTTVTRESQRSCHSKSIIFFIAFAVFFVLLWGYCLYDTKHQTDASQCANFLTEFCLPFMLMYQACYWLLLSPLNEEGGIKPKRNGVAREEGDRGISADSNTVVEAQVIGETVDNVVPPGDFMSSTKQKKGLSCGNRLQLTARAKLQFQKVEGKLPESGPDGSEVFRFKSRTFLVITCLTLLAPVAAFVHKVAKVFH